MSKKIPLTDKRERDAKGMISLAGIKLALEGLKGAKLMWVHPDTTARINTWQCQLEGPYYVRVSGFGKTPKAAVQAAIERYKEETNGSRKDAS